MQILVTGAEGFIGQNLISHLSRDDNFNVDTLKRGEPLEVLERKIRSADTIFHLAGANRPDKESDFETVNVGLTGTICDLAQATGKKIPIVFSSSVQAELDNPYGISKLKAENILREYEKNTSSSIYIFRLTNVMGKWCRPNYNSVVATFCHNIVNDIPLEIHDPEKALTLVYIDDLVMEFMKILRSSVVPKKFHEVKPEYVITLQNLADKLRFFKEGRHSLYIDETGDGLTRALYATFLSYLDKNDFSYTIPEYTDERGRFSEILKTLNCGQVSFLTAKPGVIRGRHYHHTKSEKFLVVHGEAEFNFRHLVSGERHKIRVTSDTPTIVETIPGWIHDIKNTGNDDLIVFLWANEVFDRDNPDTYGIE